MPYLLRENFNGERDFISAVTRLHDFLWLCLDYMISYGLEVNATVEILSDLIWTTQAVSHLQNGLS